MGIVTCSRCRATATADSIEKGKRKLDHSIGIYQGKPCEDGKAELFFSSDEKEIIVATIAPTITISNQKKIDKKTTKASSYKQR